MGKPKVPKTIFFIAGIEATAEELAEAETYQPGMVLRSAMRSHPGEAIEPFDQVKGTVPEHYANSDGRPQPFLTKRAKKLARIEAEQGPADAADRGAKAVPQRRGAAKAMAVPGTPETGAGGPQAGTGSGWGAPPAAAPAPAPTPAATPPVWKPNA